MFIAVIFINYAVYYKDIEENNIKQYLETSGNKSSLLVLGSFSLISDIYLYSLIVKPISIITN